MLCLWVVMLARKFCLRCADKFLCQMVLMLLRFSRPFDSFLLKCCIFDLSMSGVALTSGNFLLVNVEDARKRSS